jgi:predicted CXXCH cytochrome family protein
MRRSRRGPLLFGGILLLVLTACVTQQLVTLSPPRIPGAEYVGSESCAMCHDRVVARFEGATHAHLPGEAFGAAGALGCEGCHGPGSLHVDSGGEVRDIIAGSPQVCLSCHQATGAEFRLPHSHPVLEGKMACTDCHDPHEGRHDGLVAIDLTRAGADETCLQCHAAQRGPFIFEHEASEEGCLSCHRPHGSVNAKMLTARNSNLCLSCHFVQQTAAGPVIGEFPHPFINKGACWSAGCHQAVHGSQVNPHLRY